MTSNTNPASSGFIWKGLLTGFLILLMLIPALMVQNLVEERRQRQQEVIEEVSSKWASAQSVKGPFLLVPFTYTEMNAENKRETYTRKMVILPNQLTITGNLSPEIKRRTIYDVALYRSNLQLSGDFDLSAVKTGNNEIVHWKDAVLALGLSDVRGIEKQVSGQFDGSTVEFEAGIEANNLASTGISIPVNLSGRAEEKGLTFTIPVSLKGSESFEVLPLGRQTNMQLKSPWNAPSFDGKFLPEHDLSEAGFTAKWQVLHFNRNFPQVWMYQEYPAADYAFGLSLLQPNDNYAKTLRSVKYAILFIGLTFSFFFLLEILVNKKIHPVQYVLVGIALVVFYTLLLSIGEMVGFDAAYALATLATVGLITWYSKHLFGSWRNAFFIGGFLSVLYVFIYVLIRLEDSALLLGSLGLFVLVGVAMYFSKKIKWYEPSLPNLPMAA